MGNKKEDKRLWIEIKPSKNTVVIGVHVEFRSSREPPAHNLECVHRTIRHILNKEGTATVQDIAGLAIIFPKDSGILKVLSSILSTGTIKELFGPWRDTKGLSIYIQFEMSD